jgi:hypothetical protein
MSLILALIVFLIGVGVGWFLTRSLLFGIIAGVFALLIYGGIITIGFNPGEITKWLG